VGEDEAGVRAAFGGGGWVEPAAEGYSVSCFEGDICRDMMGGLRLTWRGRQERMVTSSGKCVGSVEIIMLSF